MRYRLLLPVAVLTALLTGGVLFATSGGARVAQQANNAGTVKIFDGDKELPANDPKVCGAFTVRGLGFEAGETVEITIVGQGGPNAGTGSFSDTVTTDAGGAFTTAPITLTPGMYKLDSEDGEGGGDKNKVFKVECETTTTTPTTPPVPPTQVVGEDTQQAPGSAQRSAPAAQPVGASPNLTG